MPTVSVDKEDLFKLLGREFTIGELDDLGFQFGLELDDDTSDSPAVLSGQERAQLKFDVAANRYDLLCIEGIANALNIFLGNKQPPKYNIIPPTTKMCITSSVTIRPFAAGAILRGVSFTKQSYESFIALQDKLHANLARQRSLVAIGTHDLDKTKAPFLYDQLKRENISFVPLNQEKLVNGTEIIEFYKNDRHLSPYLPLIEPHESFPVIMDSEGSVCSLPPLINSDKTKITLTTKNIFIEATATDEAKLDTVINIISSMFSVYSSTPYTIEQVEIQSSHNDRSRVTPDLSSRKFPTSYKYLVENLGVDISPEEVCKLLGRMSLDAEVSSTDTINVFVPCTRPDILHPADVVEDLAIAYGYDRLPKKIPTFHCNGRPYPLNQLADTVKEGAALAGFLEVLPLTLCSIDENFKYLRREPDETAVRISNPKTAEFQMIRTTLLPGLLKTVRENKKCSLPIRLFEVYDVCKYSPSSERQSVNERHFAAVYVGKTSGFEVIHGLLDRIMGLLNTEKVSSESQDAGYFIKPTTNPTYFEGRAADIYVRKEGSSETVNVGCFGIVHPEVLEAYQIPFAVSCIEFNIELWL